MGRPDRWVRARMLGNSKEAVLFDQVRPQDVIQGRAMVMWPVKPEVEPLEALGDISSGEFNMEMRELQIWADIWVKWSVGPKVLGGCVVSCLKQDF